MWNVSQVKALRNLAILVPILMVAGCSTGSFDDYQKVITKFQTATVQTSSVTKSYILDLNTFQRNVEFDRLRAEPRRALDIDNAVNKNSFEPVAIQIRVQSLLVITKYADMLAKVAGSNPDEDWKKATANLQTSLTQTATTINGLGANIPSSVSGFVGPLTALSNFIGVAILNTKREKALDDAIKSAKPHIASISKLLRDDIMSVYDLKLLALEEPITNIGLSYRQLQAMPNSASKEKLRLEMLDRLEGLLIKRDAMIGGAPLIEKALSDFDKTHDALAKYADEDKTPDSLSDLKLVVDEYSELARTVYDSYKDYRTATAN